MRCCDSNICCTYSLDHKREGSLCANTHTQQIIIKAMAYRERLQSENIALSKYLKIHWGGVATREDRTNVDREMRGNESSMVSWRARKEARLN